MASPSPAAEAKAAVPFFRKPTKRPASSRTKARSPSPSSSTPSVALRTASSSTAEGSSVVVPVKKSAANLLIQGTKGAKRERGSIDVQWSSGNASLPVGYDPSSDNDEDEQPTKRARLDPGGLHTLGEEEPDDGLYHGAAAYKSHLKITRETPKALRAGPVRAAPGTIKMVTVVDYQPDVCKDYKETGYCGFGDTCKFLHDRGTYLAGWQLDKLAESQARAGNVAEEPSSDEEEDIPFACLLCRKPYTDPIITKCGHYFCSSCAINRFKKTPKCAACGAPTGGMFNGAGKKVDAMRKRMEAKAGKGIEGDEEVPEGAGDGERGGGGGTVRIEGLGNEGDDSD